MTRPTATRRRHQQFCEIERWSEVRNARGRPTQHHITYELALPDGRVLRTRISRPANTEQYGPRLWSHILAEQLQVTDDEFWTCVDHRRPPQRHTVDTLDTAERKGALPAGLAVQLVNVLHLTSAEVAELTLPEAVQLMADHRARPTDGTTTN